MVKHAARLTPFSESITTSGNVEDVLVVQELTVCTSTYAITSLHKYQYGVQSTSGRIPSLSDCC